MRKISKAVESAESDVRTVITSATEATTTANNAATNANEKARLAEQTTQRFTEVEFQLATIEQDQLTLEVYVSVY